MTPLTDDEAALLYHVQRYGSEGYPIAKYSGKWIIGPFRSWKGFPVCYKTKKAAIEKFERWAELARERWATMREANPNAMITAVGIR